MKLSNIRKNFGIHNLEERHLPAQPIELLKIWLKEISEKDVPDFNAMVVSTVSIENKPSSRVVLLKEITENGNLVFFTNYTSRKGIEISFNQHVAINFFWPVLERQIRIEGKVSKISYEQSQLYFDSRPLESRISAIISPQSKIIADMSELRKKAKEMISNKGDISIPENWGGYEISPSYFEFWQGGVDRLHDRIVFRFNNESWEIFRLAP
jgi:pyridoxamine 5'-phosphate oxidase